MYTAWLNVQIFISKGWTLKFLALARSIIEIKKVYKDVFMVLTFLAIFSPNKVKSILFISTM
jgi:hypothetical protein